MKVDLRNNMLDKKSRRKDLKKKNKSKNNWKKIFTTLVKGGSINQSDSVKQLSEKSDFLNKNRTSHNLQSENSFNKVERIGIGHSDFQVGKVREAEETEINDSIQSDYQENIALKYRESQYIKNYPEKILVQWQGPDYEKYPKSQKWYITMGLILSAIVVYAIYNNSPLMAIVFILIGVVGYIYLEQDQQILDFAVSYDGIVVGDEIYGFDDIKSFWIFYDPPHTRVISLYMRDKFLPYIHIPLHQVDPVEVREKMMKFIPEIKQEQNLVDVLERLLHV